MFPFYNQFKLKDTFVKSNCFTDISRKNSCDFDHGLRDGEFLVAKESKLVNITAVKDGMLRLSFQMEACLPGTIPDPPLLAAALDLVRISKIFCFQEIVFLLNELSNLNDVILS